MRVYGLLLLALVGAAVAVPNKRMGQQRIVGGTETTIEQYPYMSNMMIYLWGRWMQWCGGSLLTSRTVLSAAHCYHGDHPSEWRVRLGSSFASSGGSVYEVSDLILHEEYNDRNYNNDVAIIRLSSAAVLDGRTVASVRIAGPNYHLLDGTTVTVIGWGDLFYLGWSPEQLQHVEVQIINQEICRERYISRNEVTEGMICSGILDVGGKDACQGDSGGPVSHKTADGDVIIGVTSWGVRCADASFPGVNARVTHFSNWIATNGAA